AYSLLLLHLLKMSMVYNHFTIIDAERKVYKCHYCSYTHTKNFSTTSNMVAHLRSRHPGIFPPITRRRRLGQLSLVRPLPPPPRSPSHSILNLFNDDDIKPAVGFSPSDNSSILFKESSLPISQPSIVNNLSSSDVVENGSGLNGKISSSNSVSSYHRTTSSNNSSSTYSHSIPQSRPVTRLSSPPPFSHPSSTSLPLPSTPELEQLHARLLRAQIEREEAAARYYNALANRVNTETALIREK
ncbi:hypothetical protein PMAYCL1PPCAC_29232, partial [Pristionchus mayeri]